MTRGCQNPLLKQSDREDVNSSAKVIETGAGISAEAVARAQAIADKVMMGEDWVADDDLYWPDEANKAIKYFSKLAEKQSALIETLKTALRKIDGLAVNGSWDSVERLKAIARRALADGGKG